MAKTDILKKIENKEITKDALVKKIKNDFSILPEIISGVSSHKASIRYGCSNTLTVLSDENPKELYPYMDFFINLLDSDSHRLAIPPDRAFFSSKIKGDYWHNSCQEPFLAALTLPLSVPAEITEYKFLTNTIPGCRFGTGVSRIFICPVLSFCVSWFISMRIWLSRKPRYCRMHTE